MEKRSVIEMLPHLITSIRPRVVGIAKTKLNLSSKCTFASKNSKNYAYILPFVDFLTILWRT